MPKGEYRTQWPFRVVARFLLQGFVGGFSKSAFQQQFEVVVVVWKQTIKRTKRFLKTMAHWSQKAIFLKFVIKSEF